MPNNEQILTLVNLAIRIYTKNISGKVPSGAPKTLFPVVVLTKPTSRRALNGHLPHPP
jgi:hypothetical protein